MWKRADECLQERGGHLGEGWESAVLGSGESPVVLPVPPCGGTCDSGAAGFGHS